MRDSMFVLEKLGNGLTVVIERMPHVQSAACGFLSRTGARDDPPGMAGVSHFLEHMMFKGTPRRSGLQVNIEFDEMGSYYNAYTSKDRTFYYGWVQTADFERQLELLADMMQSTLPQEEFDLERNVVLEEIAMSADDLVSVAYDEFHEQMMAGSTMAWPVLGHEQSIKDMSRDAMTAYLRRRYAPNNLILVVAGNLDPDAVLEVAERHCGQWQPVDDLGPARAAPAIRSGVAVRQIERFHQQAVLIGFPAAAATHAMDETARAAASILGGENSRFYWNIVQKGICTRAGAFQEDYADFGLIVMYGLCEPENAERLTETMRQEAARLVAEGAEAKETQRVKNLRRTSLANESEAPFYRLGQIVDDVDYRGQPRSAEARLAAVEAISTKTVAGYFDAFPITGEGFMVSVGPRAWPACA